MSGWGGDGLPPKDLILIVPRSRPPLEGFESLPTNHNERLNKMKISEKSFDFTKFAKKVTHHIEHYVIPQYGDLPDAHIDGMSVEELKGKLSSYVARIGKVQIHRGKTGALEDCYKIAHFAQYLHDKINGV